MNGIRCKELSYLVALLAGMLAPEAQAFDARAYRLVDLTHAFNTDTIYWPTEAMHFELKRLAYGDTPAGYFYSANAFCALSTAAPISTRRSISHKANARWRPCLWNN